MNTILRETNEFAHVKMARFTQLEGDIDYRDFERIFSGRMTKGRWKIIDRYCRVKSRSPRYGCGHDWDCCGCQCGQNLSFKYTRNAVIISLSMSFNY